MLCPFLISLLMPLFVLSSVSMPTSYHETLLHFGWKKAMDEEKTALHHNQTWDLTTLSPGKPVVGYRWSSFLMDRQSD